MSTKLIPFGKKKKPENSPPPFTSEGPKPSDDGKIVDHGTLGTLEYEIYGRGVIHIFDKKNDKVRFKKDINVFEKEIKTIDFEDLDDIEEKIIEGSGDNAHIGFKKENGDITIFIKKRTFSAIEKLKSVLDIGKKKISGQ